MAASPDHGKLDEALQGIHRPYQFSYANAAARTGASGFIATDVGKLARQTDDNSLWLLSAVTPTWVAVGGAAAEDGWIAAGETWTFAAADAPTFTFTVPTDLTAKYTAGTRLKLTHAAAVKYFIVTASAFAAGDTTVTVYGGTDYTLAAGAITLPFFSRAKGPAGFPLDPIKWTLSLTDTANRTQASPVNGTWYNLGSLTLAIHIGAWRVFWQATCNVDVATDTFILMSATLSTGSTTESDPVLTADIGIGGASGALQLFTTVGKESSLILAAKTSYFLNAKGTSDPASLNFRGDFGRTIIRAICAYL